MRRRPPDLMSGLPTPTDQLLTEPLPADCDDELKHELPRAARLARGGSHDGRDTCAFTSFASC